MCFELGIPLDYAPRFELREFTRSARSHASFATRLETLMRTWLGILIVCPCMVQPGVSGGIISHALELGFRGA